VTLNSYNITLKYARLLLSAYFVLMGLHLFSQTNKPDSLIRIIHADEWLFKKEQRNGGQLLKGDVHFLHKGANLYCDSALLFKEDNKIKAFGSVYLNQGDSLMLWGDEVFYNGNTGYLIIKAHPGEVKVETDSAYLYSPIIEYFRPQGYILYSNGGHLKSKSGTTELWSNMGYYYPDEEKVIFKDSVELKHEEIELETQEFVFYPSSSWAHFIDTTTILINQKEGVHTQSGKYNLETNEGYFYDQSEWFSGSQSLYGDTLFVYNNGENAWGKCNLLLVDSVDGVQIYANDLALTNNGESGKFRKGVWVEQQSEDDTLRIFSPNLDLVSDTGDTKKFVWTTNVLLYSINFQGKTDTLIYSELDSTFFWIGNPVMWNEESQITGKEIQIQLKNKQLHSLYIPELGFMSSRVPPLSDFNQISGKSIKGYFHENSLDSILVEGNGESLYFALDEKDSTLIGMNQAAGSSILIKMDSSKISDIEFLTKPSSTMYPEKDITTRQLKRFQWRGSERPMTPVDIIQFRDSL